MTHASQSNVCQSAVQVLTEFGFDGLAAALQLLLNEAMKVERSQFLGAAPYERTDQRRGHANGFKDKTVHTRVGDLELKVPQARDVDFYPQTLERGVRSERALTAALAEMYVCGVSTRKVSKIVEELCGHQVSSSTVSRLAAQLDDELEQWRQRPLGEIPYLVFDARYEHVRHQGSVVTVAVLTAIGVTTDGHRSVLGVSVSDSEAEVHWREFFKSLLARGLHGCRYIVSDDHPGLKKAREACFVGIPWQRCQFHLMQNVMTYIPNESLREEIVAELRSVFHATDRAEAERRLGTVVTKYAQTAPKLSRWMEQNIPEGFGVFCLPLRHRVRMRTSNPIERLNREIKRRTRVVSIFPNDQALLRLVSAVLMEIDEDWMAGKKYLTM
ncbi:MAG: IS256 family transposase [Planctomycetota bacterium]|nr:IS256 family transposase [Planctomycetota bacterium]